jgi:hypothetical protein
MLRLMETASTRPNQFGSVRRCLSERTPTSTGPAKNPTSARPNVRPKRPSVALMG